MAGERQPRPLVLVADTNLFLQYRALDELPWGEVASGEESIELVVPRIVQKEIDDHKRDGNSRRSRRARAASSFIGRLLVADDGTHVVRDAGPRVVLILPPIRRLFEHERLDAARPDDQLVAEALGIASDRPDSHVIVLAGDNNLLATARACGLAYFRLPDAWRLAPEPDERDRVIQQLQRRVEALEAEEPVLSLEVTNANGRPLDELQMTEALFEPLAGHEIEELVETLARRHTARGDDETPDPLRSPSHNRGWIGGVPGPSSAVGLQQVYVAPSVDAMKRFESDLGTWLVAVRKYLSDLHLLLNQGQAEGRTILTTLRNTGARPASYARVDFRCEGAVRLDRPVDGPRSLDAPKAPIRPRGAYVPAGAISGLRATEFLRRSSLADSFGRATAVAPVLGPLLIPKLSQAVDRGAFRWLERPDGQSTHWRVEAEEFRHRLDDAQFRLRLAPALPRTGGRLRCCASATNLSEPVEVNLAVRWVFERGDTLQRARALLGF